MIHKMDEKKKQDVAASFSTNAIECKGKMPNNAEMKALK